MCAQTTCHGHNVKNYSIRHDKINWTLDMKIELFIGMRITLHLTISQLFFLLLTETLTGKWIFYDLQQKR